MLSLYLKTAGIIAPGMANWDEAVNMLRQPEHYSPIPIDKKLETLLPANERRRAARVTQLAMYAAQQTGDQSDLNQCLQVFSSANGDITTFHQIALALTMPGRPVSPTRFHNSVHNAAAGYWSIATQSQTSSTSITANSESFSAGLLEAAVQLNASDNRQGQDCLLVSYDEMLPEPFQSLIPISQGFACALLFSLNPENALCKLEVAFGDGTQSITQLSNDEMERLRQANPQAQALPLLEAIANERQTSIILPYFEQGLNVSLTPLAP